MKKTTQKRIMSAVIIGVFALSSLAFVFSGFQTQAQVKPLDTYVVNGDIDPQLENAYVNAGFTFLKFYYNSTIDNSLAIFAEQAPSTFKTNNGQVQLIVQKYESAVNYATITNANGAEDYYNLTYDTLFSGVCTHLLATSVECTLLSLNLSS